MRIWRVRVARSITKATDTLGIRNNFCFSTAAVVRRTCLIVTSTCVACLVTFCACGEIQVVGPVRKTVILIHYVLFHRTVRRVNVAVVNTTMNVFA
jgi:glycopeptide antibiotics resistance protein